MIRSLLLASLVALLSVRSNALPLDYQERFPPHLNSYAPYASLAFNNHKMRDILLKRQGIIPGPRVGRSFPILNPLNQYMLAVRDEVIKRMHEDRAFPSASSHPYGRMKRSLPNSDANYEDSGSIGNGEEFSPESSKIINTSLFHRNQRQLIPAPRVGRSEQAQPQTDLISGFAPATASGPFDGEDDLLDSASPVADRAYRLFVIPRTYLTASKVKEMLKRVALTPRIGRSDGNSPNSWLDDTDFYARVAKAPLTPRIGRSAAWDEDRALDSNKA